MQHNYAPNSSYRPANVPTNPFGRLSGRTDQRDEPTGFDRKRTANVPRHLEHARLRRRAERGDKTLEPHDLDRLAEIPGGDTLAKNHKRAMDAKGGLTLSPMKALLRGP